MKSLLLALCVLAGLSYAAAGTPPLARIPAEYDRRSPAHYEAVSTVVMQYRWLKFPLLGVISVNRPKQSFALAGMSQLGLKVFEVRQENGRISSQIPEPIRKRSKDLGESIAADVSRMFLLRAPGPGTSARVRGTQAVFTEKAEGGRLEYRYDMRTGNLVQKRFLTRTGVIPWEGTQWLVSYDAFSGNYPKVIMLKNRVLHYRITTVVKELRLKKETK